MNLAIGFFPSTGAMELLSARFISAPTVGETFWHNRKRGVNCIFAPPKRLELVNCTLQILELTKFTLKLHISNDPAFVSQINIIDI